MFAISAAFILISPGTAFAAPGTGWLLGTNANGGVLLDVNPGNGAAVPIGPMGVGVTPSLATDPLTGVVYVATGGGNPVLFTVNPANAMTALVGNTGLGFAGVGGMDFDAAGNLYAAVNIAGDGGTGSDHLAILNPINGQATIIGPFGVCQGVPPIPVGGSGFCTIEGIEGIAFDASGTLWGVHTARGAAGPPGLYTINPGNGAAAFVAPILDAGGSPPSGGLSSIQFACDGTLFGGTARGTFVNDGGFLVTVNPSTGQFGFAGPVSATGGSSLGGLTFEDPVCNTPPVASCAESVNPAGGRIPPAGSTTLPGPKGGQNEDGYYELIGEDAEDGTALVFVTNAAGSATFGPFSSGLVVKITEAPGATPTAKSMGGPISAVAAHITLDSDAFVFAVDSFGEFSPVASCLVPPPPK
jgi:hypothetical protein